MRFVQSGQSYHTPQKWRMVLHLSLLSILAAHWFSPSLYGSDNHIFSVRDSIERVTFSDPDGRSPNASCKLSPDGEHFFVITTRGILASNRLQSTLSLYTMNRVTAFVNGEIEIAPVPRQLWKVTAVPRAEQFDSYGALITKAQWTSDSSAVLFLAETGDGMRRLYRAEVRHRRTIRLSKKTVDVEDFSEAGGTIAYISQPGMRTRGLPNTDAQNGKISTVLTGSTLFNIFDPMHYPVNGSLYRPTDLWAVRGKHTVQLNAVHGAEQWHYPVAASSRFHLSVSPSGTAVIAARPVRQIPLSWRTYRSALPIFDFKRLSTTEDNAGEDWQWPWQYLYIDLGRHLEVPLADAPSASAAGYGDAIAASWSTDGNRVLFTNTFLPIPALSDPASQQIPCAAALFRVDSRTTECIAYSRYPKTSAHLRSALFGTSPHEVVLQWFDGNQNRTETYREDSNRWVLAASLVHAPDHLVERITISIHQDLNDQPTLWVHDSKTGHSRQLWNPNPQLDLTQRGEVSVYRWRDSTGYEWNAGLVKPVGYRPAHRYPLVIQTHGFSEHEFLIDGSYTTGYAAQPLAAAGIMVLQMPDRKDRHLKPVSEEASLFAEGVAAAIRQLAADGLVDVSEVGIIGFSRTSWYVETALEKYPNLFKAATLIDGVDQGYVSYILLCPESASCKNDHDAANEGTPFGENLKTWLTTAPSFHLDRIHTPLRIEAIGPISVLLEWEIYSSLRLQNQPVDFIYLPGGQHILQQPQQRYASQQGNVDWFRFWLKNYEEPNDSKSNQLIRWRGLRDNTSGRRQ